MLSRRHLILSVSAALPAWSQMLHAEEPDPLTNEGPPQLEARADFAGAWVPTEGDVVAFLAPDVPDNVAETYEKKIFRSATEIDTYFKSKVGGDFIGWFNSEVSGGRY